MTYLEIFKQHYPNVVLKGFYGNYCPAGFFKYGMDMHNPDCSAECDKCWITTVQSDDVWCENGEYEIPEEWKEISAPAQTDTAVAAFDYSELDADTAAKLENVTAEIFNVRKEYIFTMAKKVAYAHDLLANHYGGKFGMWCESIGISRDTGNNLVRVAELFGNSTDVEKQNLEQLNAKLLYEAARPSAPPELVEQVKSGDITTHKEYIALKKQLEAAEEQNTVLNAEKEQFHRASKANLEKLNEERERNSELEQRDDELQRKNDILVLKNEDLMKQIRELESHPVEATFTDNSEELERKDKEISELKEEIERLSDRNVKVFTIRLTIDEYEKLFGIVKESNDFVLMEAVKKAQIIRL